VLSAKDSKTVNPMARSAKDNKTARAVRAVRKTGRIRITKLDKIKLDKINLDKIKLGKLTEALSIRKAVTNQANSGRLEDLKARLDKIMELLSIHKAVINKANSEDLMTLTTITLVRKMDLSTHKA
jgi:hypothetical protein